jgi:hypothetical protein
MAIPLTATQYTFQGDGITASYFPGGAGGPIVEGRPEIFFSYQDSHQSKTFGEADVSVTDIDNVGAFVSVILVASEIAGGPITTFTVIVPSMGVSEVAPQSFKTKGITTVQGATLVEREIFPPLQSYKVEHLDGAASVHPVPLVAAAGGSASAATRSQAN